MDFGEIQALILLAIPVFTVLLVVRFGTIRPKIKASILGLMTTMLFTGLAYALGFHKCRLGIPFTQWLIPGICLGAILVFIKPLKVRLPMGLIIIILMFTLVRTFVTEIHEGPYVGISKIPPKSEQLIEWRHSFKKVESYWHSWLTGLYKPVYASTP